jgi:glycerol-3-phosphate dehydrogenase subunit C
VAQPPRRRECGNAVAADGEELAYHAPYHARNRGLDRQAVGPFQGREGVTVEDVMTPVRASRGPTAGGQKKYETSMAIGEEMGDAEGQTGMTKCPPCAM